MRVIVCGGRQLVGPSHTHAVETVLFDFEKVYGRIDRLACGMAAGVDQAAFYWAARSGVETGEYWADWIAHGKAAGPIRNRKMLLTEKPDFVIAFHGGRGTAHMVEIAHEAGYPVFRPNRMTYEIVRLRWAVKCNLLERIVG